MKNETTLDEEIQNASHVLRCSKNIKNYKFKIRLLREEIMMLKNMNTVNLYYNKITPDTDDIAKKRKKIKEMKKQIHDNVFYIRKNMNNGEFIEYEVNNFNEVSVRIIYSTALEYDEFIYYVKKNKKELQAFLTPTTMKFSVEKEIQSLMKSGIFESDIRVHTKRYVPMEC
jgi:hypothetical protein